MKTPFQPGCTPLVLVAAMLVTPFSPTHAADREPSQPPEKLGSRIVNFFRGLVDRDESPSGYNEYPAQRPYAPPQGQGRAPRRFNLDAPPPIPNGPSYDRGPYEDPANRAPRPRQGSPGTNPDEGFDPPAPSNQRQDLPYETPPSESPAPSPSRQKPVAESQLRQENPPSVTKSPAPKPSASPKTAESTPKPAGSGHSPVTTTSPSSDPDSTPAPEPRRQEPPSNRSSAPEEPSTVSNTPSTPKPPTSGGATAGAPLVGSKTAKPGRVKSPYPPYNELDVTGLSSGSLAMDPTTQKVFRVP